LFGAAAVLSQATITIDLCTDNIRLGHNIIIVVIILKCIYVQVHGLDSGSVYGAVRAVRRGGLPD